MRYEGCLLPILILTTCGPPRPSAESEVDEVDEITQACTAFCEVAIACSSVQFAQWWTLATVSECVDDCMSFTRATSELHDKPECEVILAEEWACAGALVQCEDFRVFEDAAHGLPGLGDNPCRPELELALDECN
jgi:hypothetical protein